MTERSSSLREYFKFYLSGFPAGPMFLTDVKNSPCNAGVTGPIAGEGIKTPRVVEQLSPRATTRQFVTATEDPS